MAALRSSCLLWLCVALSTVGLVAGFNVGIDPFGYFGTNTIGYYFSSERQFKFNLVKSLDYDAIILGDSRIAFTDANYLSRRSNYEFVNGGISGASIPELIALLRATRLDRLRLAVFGLEISDLDSCSDRRNSGGSTPSTWDALWDPLRFAASWAQFGYAIKAVVARAEDQDPSYYDDGTRSVVARDFQESVLASKTTRYWTKVNNEIRDESDGPKLKLGAKCRELLSQTQTLADKYGFALLIVFLPTDRDITEHWQWDSPQMRERLGQYLQQVQEVVPHVVDLSNSPFSDSINFWLDDPYHFKPLIGAKAIREAIERSFGTHASQ